MSVIAELGGAPARFPLLAALALASLLSCSGDGESQSETGGTTGQGGSGGIPAAGGSSGAATAGSRGGAGASGAGASAGTSGAAGAAGALGSGGAAGSSGASGAAGSDAGPTACGNAAPYTLDCGASDIVFESNGPPDNRVLYVILGDGYTSDMLDTVFKEHIENMLYRGLNRQGEAQGMFNEIAQPYLRYRKFINICALKVASNDPCVDDDDVAGDECDSVFNGHGADGSRLGYVDRNAVTAAITRLLPSNLDVDWRSVTINAGPDNWWNAGGSIMVWNGGYEPRNRSASVALHEGGHAFHRLADEYGGSDCSRQPGAEINVTLDPTGRDKWGEWLSPQPFDDTGRTGLHGAFEGGYYCDTGRYRPTDNSQMNQLPDYYNMPSMQKIVRDIYAIVDPIDSHTDNASPLTNPTQLVVSVIDPAVIKVDWSVDGTVVQANGGQCFTPSGLAPGSHTVIARAYDDTEWVRGDRNDLEQSVSWTVEIR